MWLFHRQPREWQPPPCICEQVESHVREAIAMRDEMARWKTPLQEWLALQVMPVLQLKAEPKPVEDVWAAKYVEVFNRGTQVSTVVRSPVVRSKPLNNYFGSIVGPNYLPPIADGSVSSLAILPCDGNVEAGAILRRGNGWYKVLSVSGDRMTVQRYY